MNHSESPVNHCVILQFAGYTDPANWKVTSAESAGSWHWHCHWHCQWHCLSASSE